MPGRASIWSRFLWVHTANMVNTKLWLAQRQLASDLPQKRLEAVQKLRAFKDEKAGPILVAALNDPEPAVRTEVALALGNFKQTDAVQALISALRDHSEAVQEAAAKALKKNGDASVIDPLVGLLMRGSPGVQYHTAQTLHALHWVPRTPGEEIPFYTARGDFKRVSMFGPAAIKVLAAVLRSGSEERRVAAANALAELREAPVGKLLIDALKDSETAVRVAAINGLASRGGGEVLTALVPLLKDRNRNVRVAVVTGLGKMALPMAVEALVALTGDAEWEVRAVLAEALGRLGEQRALPAVLSLAQDSDTEVRRNAVEALGRLGDERVLDNLVRAMIDEDMSVRHAAARAATMVDPYWQRSSQLAGLVSELETALRQGKPGVQVAAAGLLRRLTGRHPAGPSLPKPAIVPLADKALMEFFQRLLADPDEDVRLAVAGALGRGRSPATLPVLKSALADRSQWVRQAAEQGVAAVLALTKTDGNSCQQT